VISLVGSLPTVLHQKLNIDLVTLTGDLPFMSSNQLLSQFGCISEAVVCCFTSVFVFVSAFLGFHDEAMQV
jgi:hypothetical protein